MSDSIKGQHDLFLAHQALNIASELNEENNRQIDAFDRLEDIEQVRYSREEIKAMDHVLDIIRLGQQDKQNISIGTMR